MESKQRRGSMVNVIADDIRRASVQILRRMSSLFEKREPPRRQSQELIPFVRRLFLARYEADPTLYDENDIERVKAHEWFVRRFIEYHKGDIEAAVEALDESMKWRHSTGVNKRKLEDWPREIWQIGSFSMYGTDKEGNAVIYARIKTSRKVPKFQPLQDQFICDLINRIDCENKGNCIVIVDFTGTGISNVNMEMAFYGLNLFKKHFPLGIKKVLIYNLPWVLRGIFNTFKGFLGELQKLIKMVNAAELKEYVHDEDLPRFLGGSAKKSFIRVPEESPSFYDVYQKYGLEKADIDKFVKTFKDLVEEAKDL